MLCRDWGGWDGRGWGKRGGGLVMMMIQLRFLHLTVRLAYSVVFLVSQLANVQASRLCIDVY